MQCLSYYLPGKDIYLIDTLKTTIFDTYPKLKLNTLGKKTNKI
jgi:hypothetical protein